MQFDFTSVWRTSLDYGFNVLVATQVFRDSSLSLVTGGDDGIVRVHAIKSENGEDMYSGGLQQPGRTYDTKGGPIQRLLVHDTLKFSSRDVLAADSRGLLTIFMNGQILNRRRISDANVSTIAIDTDVTGNTSIVVSSMDGSLVAVSPYETLWRVRLSDSLKQDEQAIERAVSIVTLHVFNLHSSTSDANYVLAADSEKNVHFFQNGTLVLSLSLPSVVTSMCSGHFIDSDVAASDSSDPSLSKSRAKSSKSPCFKSDDQVAAATESGAVYVISNLLVVPYAHLSFPLTQIRALRTTRGDTDALICAGHFNQLSVIRDREVVGEYGTHDWIHSFDVVEDSEDKSCRSRSTFVVVGCLDRSVQMVKISEI